MKLNKEYIELLIEIVNKHGEDLDVVSACDVEGNMFELVHFTPTVGILEGNEFAGKSSDNDDDDFTPTAVCIN